MPGSMVGLLAVALMSVCGIARADIIIELEPNNSFAEANPLVGDNNLGAIGTLSADLPLGDPADVFSLTVLVAGNIRGTTHISTPLVSPNTILICFLDAVGTALFITPSIGENTPGQTVTWDRTLAAPGIYYASIQRAGLSIPPPNLDWDFRLSGFNSAPAGEPSNAAVIASGPSGPTAVPEPNGLILLGTALGVLASAGIRTAIKKRSRPKPKSPKRRTLPLQQGSAYSPNIRSIAYAAKR